MQPIKILKKVSVRNRTADLTSAWPLDYVTFVRTRNLGYTSCTKFVRTPPSSRRRHIVVFHTRLGKWHLVHQIPSVKPHLGSPKPYGCSCTTCCQPIRRESCLRPIVGWVSHVPSFHTIIDRGSPSTSPNSNFHSSQYEAGPRDKRLQVNPSRTYKVINTIIREWSSSMNVTWLIGS